MTRRNLHHWAAALLIASLVSCEKAPEGSGKNVKEAEMAWNATAFTEVRAYAINTKDEHSFNLIILNDGTLNPDRAPMEGVALNPAQVERLKSAVCSDVPLHEIAACFEPHHGFLFFDKDGKIIRSISICFRCNVYRSDPSGLAHPWDLEKLEGLFEELGIPVR